MQNITIITYWKSLKHEDNGWSDLISLADTLSPFLWHFHQENMYSYLYSILKCFLSIKTSSMYSAYYHKITKGNKRVKVDWICHTTEREYVLHLIEQYLSLSAIIAIEAIYCS